MGSSRHRRSGRALRAPMRSPGRPPVGRREHRQRFWEGIARGLSSEEAGVTAGVSPAVGTRWFRESGGMASFIFVPLSGRYLSFFEREEIALLHAQDCVVREALTNASKHSDAKRVWVSLDLVGDVLRLSIRDDGIGGADASLGSGLTGLRDRIEAMGAGCTWRAREKGGRASRSRSPLVNRRTKLASARRGRRQRWSVGCLGRRSK
jgi:hypothetical protein